jgi:TolB-like protein/tetratricopeptide (TPR) repeat protein
VSEPRAVRRTAVIMSADVVGYSRLMGIDEEGTLAALNGVRRDLVDRKIEEHAGHIVREMGDGLLVEFGDAVEAVRCAVEIQTAMPHYAAAPSDRSIRLRLAVHLGEVVTEGAIIYGDAILVASHLEAAAAPGGINVSAPVRDRLGETLDLPLEDLGERRVANIAAPVRMFRVALPDVERAAPGASLAGKPVVAVLPFQNLSGDSEAEFFLDSVAEDLITELSRGRWFSVVARNTSFIYKNQNADLKRLARELAVRYVVEGSLRKAGDRVRLACQLVEAESGEHLWADRFDGALDDTFELQDRVATSVIAAVAPVLRRAEIARAEHKPPAQRDAYDWTLCALIPVFAETPEQNNEALRRLATALQRDPTYPSANALAAWCRQQRHLLDWPGAETEDREAAKRLARTAIAFDGDVPLALAVAGTVRAMLTRDHDSALAAVERATKTNPNSALALAFDALTRCICGDYDKAIERAAQARQSGALEPLAYHGDLAAGLACVMTGRYDDAIDHARRALDGNRNLAFSYCVLTLAWAHLGRGEDAARTAQQLRALAPSFRLGSLRRIRFADAARLRGELELLGKAGLPA